MAKKVISIYQKHIYVHQIGIFESYEGLKTEKKQLYVWIHFRHKKNLENQINKIDVQFYVCRVITKMDTVDQWYYYKPKKIHDGLRERLFLWKKIQINANILLR